MFSVTSSLITFSAISNSSSLYFLDKLFLNFLIASFKASINVLPAFILAFKALAKTIVEFIIISGNTGI